MADKSQAAPSKQPAPAQSLDRPARNYGELKQLLSRPDVVEQIKLTLPRHMSPERLTKVMLSAVLKTPALLEVNQLSLLQVLAQLSELGLEPGSAMGHVYLLPFKNKREGRTDVNVIIGYRGYIELARRSGNVAQIETHVVFEGDEFELVYGLDDTRKLRHVPNWKAKRDVASAYLVYCICRLKDGAAHVEVMSMNEVREIRDNTQGWRFKPNSGPWQDNFLEMARKTVIRRAAKYLSLSAEIRELEEMEDSGDTSAAARSMLDVKRPDLTVAPPAGEDVASQMAARAAKEEPEDAEVVPPGVDPATGEVLDDSATPVDHPPVPEAPEPEKGGVDHLLWRIARADKITLPYLKKEAYALSKDEPRRLEVSKAISERQKAVGA